jgi:hypothetical protein
MTDVKQEIKHDIKSLDHRAGEVVEALTRLSSTRTLIEELRLKIFPRPGWTTPAEFALVAASLTALRSQVETTAALAASVVSAARQVGR